MDLGESSDDSDFNVDEAKLNDDDDISINSDPDEGGNDDEESEESEDDKDDDTETCQELPLNDKNISVSQLLEQARQKQAMQAEKVNNYLVIQFFYPESR